MSKLTRSGNHITVGQFARVPGLPGLSPVERPPYNRSGASSRRKIDLEEGCLLTNAVSCMNQVAHLMNMVRGDESCRSAVESLISGLRISPVHPFNLDHPSNLVNLNSCLHTAFDLYALFGVTASPSTLDDLLAEVTRDNGLRALANEKGTPCERKLNFKLPCFQDPEYQLVVLHPEHLIPENQTLTVYGPGRKNPKHYVVAQDRHLRESLDLTSPSLPPFRPDQGRRSELDRVNIFLVLLNAEMKFQRYFEMAPPSARLGALPDDVLLLMRRTIELVRLLYWEPIQVSTSNRPLKRRANQHRSVRRRLSYYISGSSQETEISLETPDPS